MEQWLELLDIAVDVRYGVYPAKLSVNKFM